MTSGAQKTIRRPSWGLLPEDIIEDLNRKQWQNTSKRQWLLKNKSSFPIRVSLKPPRGNAVLEDINHFQRFVASWKRFFESERSANDISDNGSRRGCEVFWENRRFRSLAEQIIPTTLSIPDIGVLARLLGKDKEHQLKKWQSKIAYVLDALAAICVDNLHRGKNVGKKVDKKRQPEGYDTASKQRSLFCTLIDNLDTLNEFDNSDLELLVKLIPQLKRGLGRGYYLRALPITFVDTKFIENNLRMIESIVAVLIDEDASESGLLHWLQCKDKPKGWLLIKPLCDQTTAALGGVPLLRLCADILVECELSASNILIIENEQSCLALNNIPDTIAISGGGKNVAWMRAGWLADKKVGYWGDIDSEGLCILSDARSKLSAITPLMMDATTVEAYQERMVAEPDSVFKDPMALTKDELDLFHGLRSGKYANTRLEQERLPMDYVSKVIASWLG